MGQAFLYGNGSGSGTCGILTVTAPAGDTVTISKDGKTKTKIADSSGQAVFKSLKAGKWTVTITNGSQTATKTVNVVTDYAVTMTYFSATIAATWPEGSSCTCSDGSTTLTAPTTSGSYTFTVPNAGTWTVSCTDGTDSDSETVTITTDGESKSVELSYSLALYQNGKFGVKMSGAKIYIAEEHKSNAQECKATNNDGILTLSLDSGAGVSAGYATDQLVDLSAHNRIDITVTGIKCLQNENCVKLAVTSERTGLASSICLAKVDIKKAGDYTLDVSGINKESYIAIIIPDYTTGSYLKLSKLIAGK